MRVLVIEIPILETSDPELTDMPQPFHWSWTAVTAQYAEAVASIDEGRLPPRFTIKERAPDMAALLEKAEQRKPVFTPLAVESDPQYLIELYNTQQRAKLSAAIVEPFVDVAVRE